MTDLHEHVEALVQSVLAFPPCRCGRAVCPDSAPADEEQHQGDGYQDDEHSDSPTLLHLRARMCEDNTQRRYGR
ncbi:hypothetical protein ACFC0M_28735 [Streptomyces sp. NPDC056149]|uniref:hypothetical protein n=1 Tax=Streptomyces sp. NPDC056149 TaxID=3345728 RepID=UPI0035E35EB5